MKDLRATNVDRAHIKAQADNKAKEGDQENYQLIQCVCESYGNIASESCAKKYLGLLNVTDKFIICGFKTRLNKMLNRNIFLWVY